MWYDRPTLKQMLKEQTANKQAQLNWFRTTGSTTELIQND